MSKTERLTAIAKLEELRKSQVIAYLTADRGLVNLPVAEDVVRIIYDHLRDIGKTERLDLFLYSRGGDTNVPWPLVSICRHFAKHFAVLVPYRAHSAATQIAMGADKIVMGPLGELTQVDPSLKSEYTPPNPAQAGQTLNVSVEDLRAYFDFMRDQKLGDAIWTAVVDLLRENKLQPLAIGQVQRALGSIQYISEQLLATHIKDDNQVKKIAKAMVTEMKVHAHKIKQAEAEKIGLPAVLATPDEDEAMWAVYKLYESDMELAKPIRPSSLFTDVLDSYAELKGQKMVYVESSKRTDVFSIDVVMGRTLQGIQAQKVQVTAAPAGGHAGGPPPAARPIWGPNVTFSVEREWWSAE